MFGPVRIMRLLSSEAYCNKHKSIWYTDTLDERME